MPGSIRRVSGYLATPARKTAWRRRGRWLWIVPEGRRSLCRVGGVWPSRENMHVVETFRRGLGETRSVREAPVHLFSAGEMENCWSMTALCLHNYWDFLLLPSSHVFLINISH